MSSNHPPQQLLTVGAMAARIGVPLHRVTYLIRFHRIEPTGRAGILRVFSWEQMNHIRGLIATANQEREGLLTRPSPNRRRCSEESETTPWKPSDDPVIAFSDD